MSLIARGACVFLALFAAFLLGCSKMPATVSGTVTLDGQPLATGNIAFNRVGGSGAAIGTIRANGAYDVSTGTDQGLQPGEYIVTVVATEPVPPPIGTAIPTPPKLITPVKYQAVETSDLKCTIQAGRNTFSPELKSQ